MHNLRSGPEPEKKPQTKLAIINFADKVATGYDGNKRSQVAVLDLPDDLEPGHMAEIVESFRASSVAGDLERFDAAKQAEAARLKVYGYAENEVASWGVKS